MRTIGYGGQFANARNYAGGRNRAELMELVEKPLVFGRLLKLLPADQSADSALQFLLERVPKVCLFVRPENAPAIRVYEAVGMRRHGSYRSLIF